MFSSCFRKKALTLRHRHCTPRRCLRWGLVDMGSPPAPGCLSSLCHPPTSLICINMYLSLPIPCSRTVEGMGFVCIFKPLILLWGIYPTEITVTLCKHSALPPLTDQGQFRYFIKLIYFHLWLPWAFAAVHGLLVAARRLSRDAASRVCSLGAVMASLGVEHGVRGTQSRELRREGLVSPRHVRSPFLDRGANPCPLHCTVDS